MSELSTAELPVLHALRLVGAADPDHLGSSTGLSVATVEHELAHARDDDLATIRGSGSSRWVLTKRGREEVERRLGEQLDRLGTRSVVEHLYAAFVQLNPRILELCTEWQLREVDGELVANDHRDSVHDRWVLTRLQATHREARPTLASLADAVRWFEGYGVRLDTALEHVLGGQHQWVDSPAVDSYHSVWFELHEDLLASLGLQRHTETCDTAEQPGRRREIQGP